MTTILLVAVSIASFPPLVIERNDTTAAIRSHVCILSTVSNHTILYRLVLREVIDLP
jgi:protein-disulfide isomerase-like protein with CxxC motif